MTITDRYFEAQHGHVEFVHVLLLIVLFVALAVFCYFVIGAKFRWARKERAALDSGEKRPFIRLGHRRHSPDQDH